MMTTSTSKRYNKKIIDKDAHEKPSQKMKLNINIQSKLKNKIFCREFMCSRSSILRFCELWSMMPIAHQNKHTLKLVV